MISENKMQRKKKSIKKNFIIHFQYFCRIKLVQKNMKSIILLLLFFISFFCFSQETDKKLITTYRTHNFKLPWEIKFETHFADYINTRTSAIPHNYNEFKYLILSMGDKPETEKINLHIAGQSEFRYKNVPSKPSIMSPVSYIYEYFKTSSRLERNQRKIQKAYMEVK
ncbi:MAG: hypothetical protein A2275_14415 [Bacteroidetes bacterium RIFOXYA12_FULL_35_11]|nr:MAG: hypothetical protein A2X01_03335 [Bacteroidetes bacterium GWF2_35_48]OFY76034.1 MAG: hypothetical protein A2275_14415 [Bacteroidetes bacterium RIFOXYA12_FULL_35_11]OFY94911.1 MAG: hypothetical protein A2491_09820 [Bacteroidetes bacterium RIFOXYC12_FULL_35_7]OFY96964.1 MAG: hypothetical protein A2309_12485 [Bacteroidetes bacterium RIFOXYB2_FULL_35_7]HBX51456.1 hypothetical protein [Bacteroidales bacterium]